MKERKIKGIYHLSMIVLTLLFISIAPTKKVDAASASAVTIGTIDYEALTIQIFNNNNTAVYYSIDETNWIEVEAPYSSTTNSYYMDISWVSETSDVDLYLKGDIITKTTLVTIPMKNSSFNVIYDKVEGEFTFEDAEESDFFEWRKTSDYNWNKVSLNDTYTSYKTFLATVENMTVKGAKIMIRLPQAVGDAKDNGRRPSKEITITIPARTNAPNVSVNSSRLTINTTTAMEYYDTVSRLWIECERTMSLEDIAPKALYANGGQEVSLMIRTAATSRASHSKTAYLTIKGQAKPPEIGDNTKDVTYYYVNSKLVMAFNNASTKDVYEYSIAKQGTTFDPATARWSSVTSNRLITFSNSSAPKGCTVYVRKKGTDANKTKNIELVLSSAINSFEVNY